MYDRRIEQTQAKRNQAEEGRAALHRAAAAVSDEAARQPDGAGTGGPVAAAGPVAPSDPTPLSGFEAVAPDASLPPPQVRGMQGGREGGRGRGGGQRELNRAWFLTCTTGREPIADQTP